MNSEQIGGLVRTLLLAAVAYASGRGYDMTFIGDPAVQAAAVTIVVAGWSWWAKRDPAP